MRNLKSSLYKRAARWKAFIKGSSRYIPYQAEAKAVQEGITQYKKFIQHPAETSPLLRRNIHRLEKALCFPIKKDIYATAYIQETVEIYRKVSLQPDFCPHELIWAKSVLERYFNEANQDNIIIKQAHLSYRVTSPATSEQEGLSSPHLTPYPYSALEQPSAISADDFMQLCKTRVSCRWFEPQQVEIEKIHYALKAASQAASACNRQPFKFLHIRNEEMKKKIAALPFGTKGFGDKLPELFVVVGDLSNFSLARDRHLIFIDASLAVSQFLLALVVQRLAGVPVNWPDDNANHQSLRALLNLEPHYFPIMLIGCGYPLADAMIPFSQKKDIAQLLKTYD